MSEPKKPISSFEALQEEWYSKLKESDFVDIEDTTRPERPLKSWHGSKYLSRDPIQFPFIRHYYDSVIHFLNKNQFKNWEYREIWRLHAEGLGAPEIALEFPKYGRSMIVKILKSIRTQMEAEASYELDENEE